ncbi:MAG: A/G-specific adenine glycosylase [Pseudomonadota bacterium]|nr:A/G-specific adenine glycosylase [Pseudomonadota bacterium]
MNKKSIADFHRRLHRWYAAHGRRELPWRTTADPYAIYISEVMLQQTQVKTVLERYYFQFLRRFPSLPALAAASRKDVLTAWQGLGYYNRAANLHEAAKRCHGTLPDTVDELMALPGIGRNTAHAVAAFAYRQAVAVMEANVKRVLSRIFALEKPDDAGLWEKARLLLDTKEPFDYNQAMMDIGSMLCARRAPRCPECPAQNICEGKASPQSYPAPKSKKAPPLRRQWIIVRRNSKGEIYATPRKGKFLNGLYHFCEGEGGAERRVRGCVYLGHIRQQYSHFTLEAEVYMENARGQGKHWHSPAQLKKLPMSAAEKKILQLL